MGKHKGKIIAICLILVALGVSFALGGNPSAEAPDNVISQQQQANTIEASETSSSQSGEAESQSDIEEQQGEAESQSNVTGTQDDTETTNASGTNEAAETVDSNASITESEDAVSSDEERRLFDQYLTGTVEEGKPKPIEPEEAVFSDKEFTCTLSVVCHTLLDNFDSVDPAKQAIIPSDGIVFPATTVTFYEGESVFNILQREMKQNKIHFEFVNTPIYNSAYIEGIANLYEFDGGELSGWIYSVNDWFPNYGISRYALQDGDTVQLVYTCDLGRDVEGAQI